MIKILRISAKNFLSLGSVNLELHNKGLTMIDGINEDSTNCDNNGSGKSSIIEAIVYSLYGKTIRGISDDSLVNRTTGKHMEVSIEIEVEGTLYTIIRRRKYSGKNNIELWCNGKDVTPYSEKEMTAIITQLLGISYKIFISSIVYSDKSVKFSTATSTELKEMFEEVLNIDFLTECYEVAKSRITLCEGKLKNIEVKKSELLQSVNTLQELKKQAQEEYERNIKSREVSMLELEEDLEASRENIEILRDELKEIFSDIEICRNKVEEIQDKLINGTPEFTEVFDETKYNEAIESTRDELGDVEHLRNSQKDQYSYNIRALNKKKLEIEDIKKALASSPKVGDKCKLCGHTLTKDNIKDCSHQQEYFKVLESEARELEELCEREKIAIEELTERLEEANTKLLGAKKAKKLAQEEYDDRKFKFLRDNSNKELKNLLTENKSILKNLENSKIVKEKSIAKSEERIKIAKHRLKELEEQVIKNNSEMYNSKIEEKEKQLKIAETNYQKEAKELESLEFWKIGFGNNGIKALLMEDIVPFLNEKVNSYLKHLADNTFVEFSTTKLLKSGSTKETFTVTIWKDDTPIEYSLFSGGEKKRIDIAIILGMQDLLASRSSQNINISFLDEVFDALDTTGVESIIKVLQELMKNRDSVFVITHNSELKSLFSSCITVKKEDGISKIV